MIPNGPVYIELRKRVLFTYPERVNRTYKTTKTFIEWLQSGSYTVPSTSKREIILETSAEENECMSLK